MATFRKVDVAHPMTAEQMDSLNRDGVANIPESNVTNAKAFVVHVYERDWLRARYSRLLEHDGNVRTGDFVVLRWHDEYMPFMIGRVGVTTALLIPLEMV